MSCPLSGFTGLVLQGRPKLSCLTHKAVVPPVAAGGAFCDPLCRFNHPLALTLSSRGCRGISPPRESPYGGGLYPVVFGVCELSQM